MTMNSEYVPVFLKELVMQVGWLRTGFLGPNFLKQFVINIAIERLEQERLCDELDPAVISRTDFVQIQPSEMTIGLDRVPCVLVSQQDLDKIIRCQHFVACGLERVHFNNEITVS